MMLLSRARRGASGKAATKMVVKPNWRTAAERIIRMSTLARKKNKCWGLNNSLHLHGLFPSPESQNTILSRSAFFTHFEILIHKPMGVHRLQIPVLVPLRKLGLILYILPSTTSFLHLSTRPPVLQQTENIESSDKPWQSTVLCRNCFTEPHARGFDVLLQEKNLFTCKWAERGKAMQKLHTAC